MFSPVVIPLDASLSSVAAFRQLAGRAHCLFLDSALQDEELGRYSFVAADPFARIVANHSDQGEESLQAIARQMTEFAVPTLPGLPPFQGGAAGLLGYDLNRSWERIPATRYNDLPTPVLDIGLYDVVLAFDHLRKQGWLVSHGWPEKEPAKRAERAQARAQQFIEWLEQPAPAITRSSGKTIPLEELAPQFAVPEVPGVWSDFTREAYLAAVRRAVEYIYAGDIFQVNLAQRLLCAAHDDAVALYLRLRQRNPATFAGYYDLGEQQIVSASPERFVSVRDGCVEARPIKGTRPRSSRPEADFYAAEELQRSEKDRAENVMIVDLLRNDLARVCEPESVQVTQLCGLEVYQYVQHLVSVVRGTLSADAKPDDVIRAAFPGGSITGAPKVRAMEIVAELEPTARGPYCGSLGYWGFDGTMDWSILIRTITAAGGWWQFPVGGGIVAQSQPEREYDETWHKAVGMLKALR